MTNIEEELEDNCRDVVRDLKNMTKGLAPLTSVAREMALILDHIDKIRIRQRLLAKRLLEKELELNSQILNLEDRPDLLPSWLERTRLKNELQRMIDKHEMETQQRTAEGETEIRRLQHRLLQLWNMHDQLSENGHSEITS